MGTFFSMLAALAVWDFIKLVWVSWRKVMNRDYDGAWWPKGPGQEPASSQEHHADWWTRHQPGSAEVSQGLTEVQPGSDPGRSRGQGQ